MDFVARDAGGQSCPKGVVVNMSLGGGFSAAVNDAAASIVSAGLFLAVAAGNEATDASTSSPASERSVCTVGATTIDDQLAYYSNFGSIVDILAPGTDIKSTWIGGKTVCLLVEVSSKSRRVVLRLANANLDAEYHFRDLYGHPTHCRARSLFARPGFSP